MESESTGPVTPDRIKSSPPKRLSSWPTCIGASIRAAWSCWPPAPNVRSGLDAGERPDFLPQTKHIRESEWTVAPIPADLQDRRVEITGPAERKMIINALNSGANVFMADFEDSITPTWMNMIDGQINLQRRRPPHHLLSPTRPRARTTS